MRNGLRLLERDAHDVRREPLFSDTAEVWSNARFHVSATDRLKIAAAMAENGPQSIVEIEERKAVRNRLPDDFSKRQLDGALMVLTQENNPARAHQSASSFRELTSHVLEKLAPDAEVTRCAWFKQDKNVQGPTRRQRALYACRGGLTDDFLKSKLGIKPADLHSGLGPAVQELNKRTHVRPETELK